MVRAVLNEPPHGLWVFKDQIRSLKREPEPGEEIVVAYKGKIVGTGFYNPNSKIRIRLFSYKEEKLDLGLLRSRIAGAFRYRLGLGLGLSCRLVFAESDLLPGLIIDRYQDIFVLQTLSLGMAKRLPDVVSVLKELFSPSLIYQKDNSPLRQLEGLKNEERILFGKVPEELIIEQDDLRFYVDVRDGQKTGFYLDQRLNRQEVARLSSGKRVLDLFTYTGSFALYARKGGARSVLGVDQSKPGIELAEKNLRLNWLKCDFLRAEVFNFLREHKESYDLIIIDPPSFTRTIRDRDKAIKGYERLFILAIEHLNPYGIIVLSSCSHYITIRDLIGVVSSGSDRKRRRFKIFKIGHQAPDHPILPGMEETEYLRCLFLQSF
ncbi:MAG TPA: class I SAM-dependent rRNA methyltransferase [bacterium (Candidatus Stahlbacteria)]|nr:class I SAM-dependent rRNA methyltransferase [Candidatus Stahlbacteria bacterium]